MDNDIKDPGFIFPIIPVGMNFFAMIVIIISVWIYKTTRSFEQYTPRYELTKGNRNKKAIINRLRNQKKSSSAPPPYPNGWFLLLQSYQLKNGAVQEVNVLGLNLVAWRGESGQAYVADAYCPHLGAHLGVGSSVSKECITCPFHGWKFQGRNGALTDIPYSTSTKLPNAKIKMHKILEQEGVIYIWYHAEGEEPNWLPSEHPRVKTGEWVCTANTEEQIEAHVQDICENSTDFNHFHEVHHTFLNTNYFSSTYIRKKIAAILTANYYDQMWKACNLSGKMHISEGRVSSSLNFLGTKICEAVTHVTEEGPGKMSIKSSFGRMFSINVDMFVTPADVMSQNITMRLYSNKYIPALLGRVMLTMYTFGLAQDKPIFARKSFLESPCLTKDDTNIKRFREYYSQFYTPNSVPMSYQKKLEDM